MNEIFTASVHESNRANFLSSIFSNTFGRLLWPLTSEISHEILNYEFKDRTKGQEKTEFHREKPPPSQVLQLCNRRSRRKAPLCKTSQHNYRTQTLPLNINKKTKLTGGMTDFNSTLAKYKLKKKKNLVMSLIAFPSTYAALRITIEPAFRMISGRKSSVCGYSGTRG